MAVTDSETSGATNAPAWSVSELSAALKRTLEDAYGYVRLRGEVSKVTRHASGHVYLTLKDDRAAIDGVVWKGVVRQLKVQPEQGMEVIATGKITTYPASSKYQIVIDSLEAAGVGALLAQLERLKAKLAAEGLFDERRKRPLPRSPRVIGVITSPTGAVVRDILHRIRDRWPCRVLVWPVVVQGDQAPPQAIAAIRGFNALPADGPIPRPDVLIVARGGGSVEDLWAFNDEALARAVAESAIPLVSAVGHETDTTLIDFVSDRRAPTPTGAAEMVTPVLSELRAAVSGLHQRLLRSGSQGLEVRRTRLQATARGLPRPADLLGAAAQRFDLAAGGLRAGLERNVSLHRLDLARISGRFAPVLLDRPRRAGVEKVADLGRRLGAAAERAASRTADRARLSQLAERMRLGAKRRFDLARDRLAAVEQLRLSLDPDRPLRRGFARVHDAADRLVTSAASLSPGDAVRLVFGDGDRAATISGATPSRAPKPRRPSPGQGDLF